VPKDPLSEADLTDFRITFLPGVPLAPKTVRAAYITTEDKHPDSFAFHDHQHKAVTLIRREHVLHVDRLGNEATGQ